MLIKKEVNCAYLNSVLFVQFRTQDLSLMIIFRWGYLPSTLFMLLSYFFSAMNPDRIDLSCPVCFSFPSEAQSMPASNILQTWPYQQLNLAVVPIVHHILYIYSSQILTVNNGKLISSVPTVTVVGRLNFFFLFGVSFQGCTTRALL